VVNLGKTGYTERLRLSVKWIGVDKKKTRQVRDWWFGYLEGGAVYLEMLKEGRLGGGEVAATVR